MLRERASRRVAVDRRSAARVAPAPLPDARRPGRIQHDRHPPGKPCFQFSRHLPLATTCWVENGIGSCEGTRHCADPGGLTACDGPTPSDDVCDGKDNDCDGITDNPATPIACLITNEHGSCDGVVACVNGETTCVGDTPVPEICDGLDNDCDGEADEDLCDDGDPCTLDKCLEDNTCENTLDNTLLCDDGDICTNTDKCEDGVCVGYNPTICDDGNVCTNPSGTISRTVKVPGTSPVNEN